jgi:crotonobetainyl-CoA:carnitine CoA-transferase CaiB-like acyl-CoA transferase
VSNPLSGVTVLDLTRLLPGAICTLTLADLGAEVIKVEDPRGGDALRHMPPLARGRSVYDWLFNRDKKSLTLDLRVEGSREVLDALCARADVLVESFRPRTARRLGIDALSLRTRHPRLVHCALTGFGQTGPYADHPGHDINFVALAGLLALDHAAPGETPRMPRMLIADIGGGAMSAVAGILAALFAQARTGEGATVDTSMHEGALSWLAFPAARWLVQGGAFEASDLPITGREACYNLYRTADGRHLALGALEPKFWQAFCARLGRPDLVPLQHATGAAQDRLLDEVRAILASRTREDWLRLFEGTEACLVPVNSVEEALRDPHVAARRAVLARGEVRAIRSPVRLTADPAAAFEIPEPPPPGNPPALGADTDAVLGRAGFDPAARARLRAAGVIA